MTDFERLWHASYSDGVPAQVDIPDEPLGAAVERAAEQFPDRIAVEFQGATLTYAELAQTIARGATVLQDLGVRAGDRVAIALPNCLSHVVAFYATLRLGAAVVENNPTYSPAELAHQLADSGATVALLWEKAVEGFLDHQESTEVRTVVSVNVSADLPWIKRLAIALPMRTSRTNREALRGPVPEELPVWHKLVADAEPLAADHPWPAAEDVALLQYTGGTTGTPKAAVLTHRNMVANTVQGQAWTGHQAGQETVYAVLPFFHAFGLTLCLTYSARIAATMVAFPKFDVVSVLATQRRRPCTFLPAVPTILDRLATAAEATRSDLTSIRFAFSGAMALAPQIAERWERVTGGLAIEGYGMTETSPVALGNPASADRRPGALGIPFPGTDIKIVDQEDHTREVAPGESGELLIRGPQVFAGYWGRPEETAEQLLEGGWLRTGDVVQMDEHGFVVLVDRIKEMIVTGGFKVYPSQVEDHLRTMPGVQDVAVVGLPGGDLGEKVVAAIVMELGHTQVELQAVRDWCAERLARYAVPRDMVILPDLPRSQIGKVLRRSVRDHIISAGPPSHAPL